MKSRFIHLSISLTLSAHLLASSGSFIFGRATAYSGQDALADLLRTTGSQLNGISVNFPRNTDGTIALLVDDDDRITEARTTNVLNRDTNIFARQITVTGRIEDVWDRSEFPLDPFNRILESAPRLEEVHISHLRFARESFDTLLETLSSRSGFRTLHFTNSRGPENQILDGSYSREQLAELGEQPASDW